MSVLENLWYGEMPCLDRAISKNSETGQARHQVVTQETKLLGLLSDEAKEMYEKLAECYGVWIDHLEKDAFVQGCKIGARMQRELLDEFLQPSAPDKEMSW